MRTFHTWLHIEKHRSAQHLEGSFRYTDYYYQFNRIGESYLPIRFVDTFRYSVTLSNTSVYSTMPVVNQPSNVYLYQMGISIFELKTMHTVHNVKYTWPILSTFFQLNVQNHNRCCAVSCSVYCREYTVAIWVQSWRCNVGLNSYCIPVPAVQTL